MKRDGRKRSGKCRRLAASAPEDNAVKKSLLTNTLVMTVRSPSKNCEALCKQLKRVFAPNCLTKLETNPRMQDVIDVADQLYVRQIVYISENEIKIACMPLGPTYTFAIAEYQNTYKNYPAELYKHPAFVTVDGKSSYGHVFQRFGKNEAGFRRALHFYFYGDLLHIRHYCTSVEDLEDKFRVSLKEIGPRLALEFRGVTDGVFPEMGIKKTRYHRKTPKE